MKQLLSNADILFYNGAKWDVLRNHYLAIDGEFISCVSATRPQGEFHSETSFKNHLLIPGLYNMHTHTSMTLLRGVGSDLPLDRWLNEAIFPIEAKMQPDDISVGTRLALMEFLAGGVVSFTDMYDFPNVTAEETSKAGLKANLSRPILAFDPQESYESNFRVKESLKFFENFNGMAHGNILVDFSIHAEYTSLPHVVEQYGRDCLSRKAHMHLHLSETSKEHDECKARYGKTPARYFYDLGVFDNPTTAAHCVHVEPEDIVLLAEKNVTAVHNPTSNMKLASGFMPAGALLEAGVNLTLGTDGAASNNNLNLFEEMHLAAILHKGHTKNPCAVSPEEVLTLATINGAKSQGRLDCGNLAEGKRADIVAIKMDAPHLLPATDIPALLTYSVQASDVKMTMVNGKVLYENGEFKTIDVEKVKYDLQKAMERLF